MNLDTLPQTAIFGGSFDPIHNGHLAIMRYVVGDMGIKHLIILPTFRSPFKHESFLSPQERLILCQQTANYLAQCYPHARIEVCDFEIARAKPTYSIESVRFLQAALGGDSIKFGFVLGWDNFAQFHLWREYTLLARDLSLLVFDRGGHSQEEFDALVRGFSLPRLCAHFIPFASQISSTHIRERLVQGDLSEIPAFLLPILKEFLQKHCYNGTQNLS